MSLKSPRCKTCVDCLSMKMESVKGLNLKQRNSFRSKLAFIQYLHLIDIIEMIYEHMSNQ